MDTPLTGRFRTHDRDEPVADLAAYRAKEGYEALRKTLGSMSPAEVTKEVTASGLRGRGGAGFPTGTKWSFVPADGTDGADGGGGDKYIVCNADEMEPGTFKDRLLLEYDPHGLVEAMAIAGYAIGARTGFVFVRWAYRHACRRLERAIEEARAAGLLGKDILGSGFDFDLQVHASAGRYICGEETALLNALEGRRALPRAKPPFPQAMGLFGRPTVVQNVETLYNVPHIVLRGAEWFVGLSRNGEGGTKLYGASGRVKRPGLWELPLGATLGEVLERAGGMRDGYRFRGCLPGGASTDFLVEGHLDVALDFASVAKVGSRLGTGTIVVLDDRTCPVGFVANLERFFARESCGFCTPCRDGLPWTVRILDALEEGAGLPKDLSRLDLHTRLLGPGRTFCALAPGAMEPLQSALRYFREDFVRHVEDRRCPYGEA